MTKLEKMQEIYRLTGIEPDKEVVTDVSCKQSSWEDEALINWSYAEDDNGEAYYTESKLWEMLPERIGMYKLTLNKEFIFYEFHYSDEYDTKWPISTEDGLCEALLDMVLWAIHNGHIKKVVKEDD
jgi:hypothetical protein